MPENLCCATLCIVYVLYTAMMSDPQHRKPCIPVGLFGLSILNVSYEFSFGKTNMLLQVTADVIITIL